MRKNLPRVHYPVGVEQFLDLLHQLDACLIFTVSQRVCFRVPDAVLSRDGSIVRSFQRGQISSLSRCVRQYSPTSSNTNGSRAAEISGVYAAAAMLRWMLPEEQQIKHRGPAKTIFPHRLQSGRSQPRPLPHRREAAPSIGGAPSSCRRSP